MLQDVWGTAAVHGGGAELHTAGTGSTPGQPPPGRGERRRETPLLSLLNC